MTKRKEKFWIGKWILIIGLFFFCSIRVSAAEEEGRVLFISSYSYAWDTVQMQIEGIKQSIGKGIQIDYEFMDTKRVDTEESRRQFHDGLAYRMSVVEPYDVIIVGDDAALLFVREYQEELFADIPIVFEGVNDEELAMKLSENPLITGVLEKLSVEKNIDFGMKINPDAKKVVAILDDSVTGEAERKRFYQCAEQYPELEFTEINTSQLKTMELQIALHRVTNDSILIYIVMTEDASGKRYSNEESVRIVSTLAPVPVIRMVEGGIGNGLLGGNIVSMMKSGQIAAEIATDIVRGVDSTGIGVVVDSPNIYCVDELVMDKFHINKSVLPEETTIINHQETFFERNREAMLPAGILFVALLVILMWVTVDNHRRRRLFQQLEDARNIMESASQHDFLTGLPNRSKFMKDLQVCIENRIPCTVMMLDIDDFKVINDTHGHTAGDDALRQVAARLKDMQSQILTPYRYAGDEFIIIIKSNQSMLVEKAAFQCRQVFGKPFMLLGSKTKVCGSIGIASYPKDTEDLEQLIIFADNAMYQVKRNGKNDFAFYDAHVAH